ncbi:MAG: hypothetical protein IT410_02495 [Candidatus Doudnabacteria bacterium]|nr:hypothetical protein [Candidatus Doudnabacteria bacterium]
MMYQYGTEPTWGPTVLFILTFGLYLYGAYKGGKDAYQRFHMDMDPDGMVSGPALAMAVFLWPIYFAFLGAHKTGILLWTAQRTLTAVISTKTVHLIRNAKALYLKERVKPRLSAQRRLARFERDPLPPSFWKDDDES